MTIFVRDTFRASVEAATGGKVTVLYSANGQPGYYCVIPKFNLQDIDSSLGTGVHPAFVIGGVTRSYLFVGQFLASIVDGRALSLPGRSPSGGTIDNAIAACLALGTGFHLMTAAEYAAMSLWMIANGFQPRGNTDYGRSDSAPYETGVRGDSLAPGNTSTTGIPTTATGSGPITWRHNNDVTGICDYVGNRTELAAGCQLRDGELQIMQDNDAALPTTDHTVSSSAWKAVRASDGVLVAPGTSGAIRIDATTTGTVAGTDYGPPVYTNAALAHANGTAGSNANNAYASAQFKNLTGTMPATLKIYGLAPITAFAGAYKTDRFSARNYGDRVLSVSGNFSSSSSAGIFARGLTNSRADGHGFRPVYYS